MIAALIATGLVCGLVGLTLGISVPTRQEARKTVREELRKAGLNQNSAKMLGRAAKILRRLDGLTELDGDLAADILTDTTKKQVSDWLADYRKGLDVK